MREIALAILLLIPNASGAEPTRWEGKLFFEKGEMHLQPCYQKEIYRVSASDEIVKDLEEGHRKVTTKRRRQAFLSATASLISSTDLNVSQIHRLVRLKQMDCGDYYKADSLDVHPSWMEVPPGADSSVRCDERACHCLKSKRVLLNAEDPSLQFRVEGVLKRLRHFWRRHIAQTGDPGKTACMIMLDQELLVLYYPLVRDKVGPEYEKYMDDVIRIKSQCVHPDIMGWTQSEKAKEWVRCLRRIKPQIGEAEKGKRGLRINYATLKKALGIMNEPRPETF